MLRARVLSALLALAVPVVASVAVSLTPSTALADDAGDKLLAEVDAAMTKAKTHTFEYDITNQEPGKAEKKLGMKVWIKGEKRLSEFTAPADMKGTKVLVISPTQMYVYLPAFGKVRRLASHVSEQNFLGMAFSQDDFASLTYAKTYTAATGASTDTTQKLTLTPKSGVTAPYGKIELTITKSNKLPSEIKYYNSEGKHIKTEVRSGYTCEQGICTPKELKMTDHSKGGHWTKFTRKSWKVNETLADALFTKRSLGE